MCESVDGRAREREETKQTSFRQNEARTSSRTPRADGDVLLGLFKNNLPI